MCSQSKCKWYHKFSRLEFHPHRFFKRKGQNPHLEILGNLAFWVCLTLSETSGSALEISSAAVSVPEIDQGVNDAVSTPSIDFDPVQLPQTVTVEAEVNPFDPQRASYSLCDRNRSEERGTFSSDNPEDFPNQSVLDPVSQETGHQTPTQEQKQPCSPVPAVIGCSLVVACQENPQTTNNKQQTTDSPASTESKTPESLVAGVHSSTPEAEPFQIANESELEQPASDQGEDPELGNLRLRELEAPPTPRQPSVYLLGQAGYLRSNNIFSGTDPIDDGLLRSGLTLLAAPSLGPRTSLFASVNGNLVRYGEQSEFDYDELRLSLGVRQQIGGRNYGEVGWNNRQLFTQDGGDRFLNEHSGYLELGRRDSLAEKLTLDTFYQFRLSFADPDNRSQAINSVGASLSYNPNPSLQAALDYQFALSSFTQRDRQDEYHQLIARLSYTMSPNSRVYVFGGHSFGASSDQNIDFDGLIFGVGVNVNFTLF